MPLTPERERELAELCRRFRIDALTAIHGAQSGHPGGSLSVCEILTLLYQERMNVSAAKAADPDRDRLVLSKTAGGQIRSMKLGGKALKDYRISHGALLRGGTLEFQCK